MSVSYNRLWKQLIDKNMKRIEMQHLTGISANILARMGKNQYVSMETVEKICKKMERTSIQAIPSACIVRPAVPFLTLKNFNPGI